MEHPVYEVSVRITRVVRPPWTFRVSSRQENQILASIWECQADTFPPISGKQKKLFSSFQIALNVFVHGFCHTLDN